MKKSKEKEILKIKEKLRGNYSLKDLKKIRKKNKKIFNKAAVLYMNDFLK